MKDKDMKSNPSWLDELRFRIDEGNLPIRADQIRSRLRFFPVMVGSQSLIEPFLVGLLWDQASHSALLAWLGVLLLIHFAEMGTWWKYRSLADTVEQCRMWSLGFKMFAGAIAGMWAVAALCFFPTDLAYQALFICVILGLSAGAVTMNPLYPPAPYLFLPIVLLPTVFRVAYENDAVHWVVAAMLALFSVVVMNSGRQLSRAFLTSLRQRYENLSLVEQLFREKSRAESASREKSRFLATASHDLRQPLQALMLFSDALQDVAQEKEAKHLAGQIGKSVNALVEMFDELLDVSRLEAGIVEARWQNFELHPLLDRLYVDLAPLAQAKGLGFDMPSGEGVVYSDPFLLDRILRNLISNAIRYTDYGSVVIACTPIAGGFRFAVIDTGIGISPEALPHIFEEYYQVDNQHRDRRKGLGLGLAIVRRVENLLGCKVEVKSEPGQGSEFSFVVRRGNTEQLAQPFVITYSRYDLRGVVVALVEDDPDIREMLAGLMADWGCRVFGGEHAEDVMRELDVAGLRPDLLVCDYRLPHGMTAVHVIARVRELWGDGVPPLVLTGDTAPEALRDIHSSGAILLHKPIAPTRLRTMMYFALHGES
ncbi:MAG: hybrid sensor histidine kinase/response regulator [Gallionellaceae bacterium]|nr:MAG: hybrid sensor histidine kinase/response regulator [Gallionellaceae bacterium]